MENDEGKRAALKAALRKYNSAIEGEEVSDRQVSDLFSVIERLSANTFAYDLYYWGDTDRSDDEFIEELIIRDRVFKSGGKAAVIERAISQYEVATKKNPGSAAAGYADQMIEYYRELIDRERN